MTNEEALKLWWYYSLEVTPGVFTPGFGFDSAALVRKLLSGVELRGEPFLDLCSMDGMVSYIAARRCAEVTAWDRIDHGDKFAWLYQNNPRAFPDIRFVLGNGLSTASIGLPPYRAVVFAGLLYHVLDPVASLLNARRMLQDGGVMIVETAAVARPGHAMWFNEGGQFYPAPESANYWLPTKQCLVSMLRMARLEVLDTAWFKQHGDVIRMAFACRAVDHDSFGWAGQQAASENGRMTIAEFIDWSAVKSDRAPVGYAPQNAGELSIAERKRLSVLRLSDIT